MDTTAGPISRKCFLLVICISGLVLLPGCQATQPEQEIIGVWSNDFSYVRYSEDGSFSVASTVAWLDTDPVGWGTYTFDGELLIFYADEEEYCKGKVGRYEIVLSEEGEAYYTTVEDSCIAREENMTKLPWHRYSP
ncbi:MAG: hypothetical protein GTO18_00745 [Anaerolineales bacterium]|nr:hypothetical protein [Anaerolineales bacterium]